MQTFLPYPSFEDSAMVLDRQRLGKQRVEAWQCLQALLLGTRWSSHPAVKMWAGYEEALEEYYVEVSREWVARGYRHTMPVLVARPPGSYPVPPWLGDGRLHKSHRTSLARKAPGLYPWSDDGRPYWWPTKDEHYIDGQGDAPATSGRPEGMNGEEHGVQ